MDIIPTEVLQIIYAYAHDGDRESLYSFSLVNHRFYQVAIPSIYKTLTIRFSNYASLERIVTEIKENPRRRQYLSHAMCLNLMAIPDVSERVFENGRPEILYLRGCPDETIRPKDLIRDAFGSPGFSFERYLTQLLNPGLDPFLRLEPGFYQEKNWQPLVSLIASMRKLKELHYVLANMFPKCLLDVIHDRHPTCRLSIWGWQRLGIREPGLEGLVRAKLPEFDDPFEIELLRSPCLHTISLFEHACRPQLQEYVPECIFPLITMAPNLKHVYLRRSASDARELLSSNQRWNDYIASMEPVYTAAPISLSVHGDYYSLLEWSKSTDFSSLRSLEFDSIPRPLELMPYLAGLQNLECLCLTLSRQFVSPQSFNNDLKSMFAGLNPLQYLRIRGTQDTSLIHEIFVNHGKTLRGFILEPLDHNATFFQRGEQHPIYPELSHHDIIKFAVSSPRLEELRLPIERSRGNRRERQLYEALGKFPSLQSLILDLDCNPRERLVGDQARRSRVTRKWTISGVMLNAAMDETLARAIWDVINSNRTQGRLTHLRISIFGEETLRGAEREVIRRLARSFLISKTPSSKGASLAEIGRQERELRAARQLQYDRRPAPKLPPRLQQVIRSLWPTTSAEVTWDFSWKSSPLEVEVPPSPYQREFNDMLNSSESITV